MKQASEECILGPFWAPYGMVLSMNTHPGGSAPQECEVHRCAMLMIAGHAQKRKSVVVPLVR